MVFGNLGDIMHDPKNFPDPFKFDPSRYLSKASFYCDINLS